MAIFDEPDLTPRGRTMPVRLRALSPIWAALVVSSLASTAFAQQRGAAPPPARPPQAPLRFQMKGPATGGRFASIPGVPGDLRTWYVGAASGGVWKSSDSGATFRPV